MLAWSLWHYHERRELLDHDSPSKIWAHRSYSADSSENSVATMKSNFAQGISGIEIDIFYQRKIDDFIISHDSPTATSYKSQLLSKLLAHLPRDKFLWLDFKNLNNVTVDKALARLLELQKQFSVQRRILVESKDIKCLSEFADEGIKTIYWLSVDDFKMPFLTRAKLGWYGVHAVSLNHKYYGKKVKQLLGRFPTLIFTVNDSKVLAKLTKKPQIKIVLTDINP